MSGIFRQSFNDTSNAPETEILGGTDQTKIGNTGDRLKVDANFSSPPTITEQTFATFIVTIIDVATANNKSMFSLQNSSDSTVKLKFREMRIVNTQNSAVTGTVVDFRFRRATSHSAGTSVTPQAFDTTDTLNGSITARTGATITGESAADLMRWKWSTDEWAQGAQDVESSDHVMTSLLPVYITQFKTKPITLNANEALTLKCVTNTTTGLFDIQLIFTQES